MVYGLNRKDRKGRGGIWAIMNEIADGSPWITSEVEKVLHSEVSVHCLCPPHSLWLTACSLYWVNLEGLNYHVIIIFRVQYYT